MSAREQELRAVSCIPGSDWNEKRTAAGELAAHGWPVLRGTYCLAGGAWLGRRDTVTLEPISSPWTADTTTDPTVAAEWWSQRPYSVLLACGASIDALELDAARGENVISLLAEASALCPIVVTPFGHWLLLVRAGIPLLPDLGRGNDLVTLHSRGSWVPMPPSALPEARYTWRVTPADVGWQLPDSAAVQDVLARLHAQVVC